MEPTLQGFLDFHGETIKTQYDLYIESLKPREDDINTIVDFSPKWPSTGVVGIHAAVNLFDKVYIYGFDTYDIKYDNHHYFEDKPNKYKNASHKDHDPSKEKQYIKYMIENKNLKLLK